LIHKSLHIVSFDIPYPPIYGGIIDVFYKIKALKELGVSIHLHTFIYGKEKQPELEKYCEKVHYYKRDDNFLSLLSRKPFIVKSRSNNKLIKNLLAHKFPILFEGLHTTAPLLKNDFIGQKTYIRTHNIEHLYFDGLYKSSTNIPNKLYYKSEAIKLKKYEKILNKVDGIFTISPEEHTYFSNTYKSTSFYIPVFHENKNIGELSTSKKQVLYHGDLRISDNIKASLFLINTYKNTDIQLITSSGTKNKKIITATSTHDNCRFIHLKNQTELTKLLHESHVNALPTFQKTGIKLKLINTLYKGKFIIANNEMVEDTGLENLCEIANNESEFLQKTNELFNQEFTEKNRQERSEKLSDFNPKKSAKKLLEIIF
jgi:hypothetical protein